MSDDDVPKFRLYLSGPMTGKPNLNFEAFAEAEAQLTEAGYDVINPTRHGKGESWEFYMRKALRDVTECDGIAYLDGAASSPGALLEMFVGHRLGVPVSPVEAWL